MTFIGRIRQHSAVWHRWRGEARTGGVLHGVHFAWEVGNVYRSLPLSTPQIALLHAHDSVDLEMVSSDAAPIPVATIDEPVEATAPAKPVYVNSRPVRRS